MLRSLRFKLDILFSPDNPESINSPIFWVSRGTKSDTGSGPTTTEVSREAALPKAHNPTVPWILIRSKLQGLDTIGPNITRWVPEAVQLQTSPGSKKQHGKNPYPHHTCNAAAWCSPKNPYILRDPSPDTPCFPNPMAVTLLKNC